MKRFQNSTFEYNAKKNELTFRDSKTNMKFFSIEFSKEKNIKNLFSIYPVRVEMKLNKIEINFTAKDLQDRESVLIISLELNQLTSDKSSVVIMGEEELSGIRFS